MTSNLRNDKGKDKFNFLANIYDDQGLPVAHLVHPKLLQLDKGETTTITFRWESATELGDHTIGIEFYAADWSLGHSSMPMLRISLSGTGRVRATELQRMVSATDGAATDGAATDGAATDGASTDGASTDGTTTDGESTDGATTDGVPSDDGPSTESSSGSSNGCTIGSANGSLLWMMALIAAVRLFRRKQLTGRPAVAC